jgi:hypothetical protein
MKTSKVGLVSAAFLMVVACVGFSITQASGNQMDRQVLSNEDEGVTGQGSPSSTYSEDRPVLGFEDEIQPREPIGTGNISAGNDADPSIVEAEGNMYRSGADTGLP